MKNPVTVILCLASCFAIARARAGNDAGLAALIRNNEYESFVKAVEGGGADGVLPRACPSLLAASCQEGRLEFVRYLVEHGCSIEDDANYYRIKPLHAAAGKGAREVVAYLVRKGAQVNAKDLSGLTALHYAACGGSEEVCSLLIKKGADVIAKNDEGATPIFQAVVCGELNTVRALLKADKKRDADAPDRYGWTLLHQACKENDDKITAFLLDKGAKVNARTASVKYYGSDDTISRGVAPLHCAASRSGNLTVIEMLLKNGAEVNMADVNDWTPLHYAVAAKDPESVRLLLKNGADPRKKTGVAHSESGERYTRLPAGLTPRALAEFLGRENSEYQVMVDLLSAR